MCKLHADEFFPLRIKAEGALFKMQCVYDPEYLKRLSKRKDFRPYADKGIPELDFIFSDETMANRVAKAMLLAVELRGGGSKPEPFC